MCKYMFITYRCGHTQLFAGPNCATVLKQLCRIHQPEAWTREGRKIVPFDWPDSCLPGHHNIVPVPSEKCCGWECQNTFAPTQHADDGLASLSSQCSSPADSIITSPTSCRDSLYPKHKTPNYPIKGEYRMDWNGGSNPSTGPQAFGDYAAINAAAYALNKNGLVTIEPRSTRVTAGGEEVGTGTALPDKRTRTRTAGKPETLGMPNARYGVPRIGVGWRNDEDEIKVMGDWWTDGEVFG
ncbi:hypothetical protein K445DRAFT_17995 [Daldinia sp. EC12]|nr:hypothetical protein K445DRAFT_17995 [Daldinia sp. EC12]